MELELDLLVEPLGPSFLTFFFFFPIRNLSVARDGSFCQLGGRQGLQQQRQLSDPLPSLESRCWIWKGFQSRPQPEGMSGEQ